MMRRQVRRGSKTMVRVLALAGLVFALSLSLLASFAVPAPAAQADLTVGPPPKTTSATTVPTRPAAPTAQRCENNSAPSAPYIHFCAPVYDDSGNAGGPNGTRVTVVGKSAHSVLPDALYFVQEGAPHPPPLDVCDKPAGTLAPTASSQAFPVMCSPDINQFKTQTPDASTMSSDGTYALTFTLTTPPNAAGASYQLVAIYSKQNSITSQMAHFQVTSQNSPCVIATLSSVSGTIDCSGQALIFAQASNGSASIIQGFNWIAVDQSIGDQPIKVVVTGVCVTGQQCTPQRISLGSAQPDTQGTISFKPQFQGTPSGIYALQAWSTIDGNAESLAAGALSFDKDTPAALVVGNPTAEMKDTSACSGAICMVPSGSTITVTGNFWPTTPRVYLTAPSNHCESSSKRSVPNLPDVLATRFATGNISAQLTVKDLKPDAKYRICANTIPVPYLIQIGSPPATPASFASPLAWIAVALALASLGLYFLRPRGRAFAAGQGYPRW